METRICKIEDINPAEYNPRITLKPGDTEYEALKNSLEKFGTVAPLVVNKTTGNLVSGHQRLTVLKQIGATETEVVFIEVDEDKEKLLNVALNKIDGEWDFDKLEVLFAEFSDDDIKFTGYTTEELDGLFATVSEPKFSYTDDSDDETESEPNGKGRTLSAGTARSHKETYGHRNTRYAPPASVHHRRIDRFQAAH